jgi:hypothetical protein
MVMKTPITKVMLRLVTSTALDKKVTFPNDVDKNKISA